MKCSKVIILFILILIEQKIFTQTNEFSMNMYVTSEEGLNVRESPSLNGTRIWIFIFGEQVTIQEKGHTATIDGLTDCWYKAVFYNGDYLESGWVFGGYLSNEPPLYIIDKIIYNTEGLPENINFTSVNDYLGKWALLDDEGNFHRSDSFFIIYIENGIYKFLIKYYNNLRIGFITWAEYPEYEYISIVMNPYNRNHALNHVPWSIVGRPGRKLNTFVALIDNEGPLGFFQRIVE